MEDAVSGKLFGFGVWRAPVLVDNLPAIWAVDQFGNVRKVRKIRPGEDAEALGERLFRWLLEHHPVRTLTLVSDPPAPTPGKLVRVGNRMVDERLLTDPRSPLAKRRYLDRLVKHAARQSGILRFRDEP